MRATMTDRMGTWLFLLGCAGITAGVLLHLPMFWIARAMGFRMAGMAMNGGMIIGMWAIVGGVALAAYGLLPRNVGVQIEASRHIAVTAPEDAPLTAAHWRLMGVLVLALMIDVMKPASLGFVMPGMTSEYGLSAARAALLPFAALAGTVLGSIAWGVAADIYGRKATILLSAAMFIGTSICGAMPSFTWNIAMCFLMGAAAGGMLPVTYALLAETMPSRHRGWALVVVGGLGAAGGYLAASGFSAWLEPIYSWRVLWLLNLPSGLFLLALGTLIPESAKFLLARGRRAEACAVMERFGTSSHSHGREEEDVDFAPLHAAEVPHVAGLWSPPLSGTTAALTLVALCWGLVNFGLLLWMPSELVERGVPMGAASSLLAKSAIIALPTVAVAALLYSRWSTRRSLVAAILLTGVGLLGVLIIDAARTISPVAILAVLVIGANALLAILLPYTAESYPLAIRGRATGWIAACTKAGGLLAQGLSLLALVPALGTVALMLAVLLLVAALLAFAYCRETRGMDLRAIDRLSAARQV